MTRLIRAAEPPERSSPQHRNWSRAVYAQLDTLGDRTRNPDTPGDLIPVMHLLSEQLTAGRDIAPLMGLIHRPICPPEHLRAHLKGRRHE